MRFRYLTEGFIFVSAVSPRLGPLSGATNVACMGTTLCLSPTPSCARSGRSSSMRRT